MLGNKLLENIQHEKRVNFSAEKCELLKINSISSDGLLLNAEVIKSARKVRHLGDVFSDKGTQNCARTDMIKLKVQLLSFLH